MNPKSTLSVIDPKFLDMLFLQQLQGEMIAKQFIPTARFLYLYGSNNSKTMDTGKHSSMLEITEALGIGNVDVDKCLTCLKSIDKGQFCEVCISQLT